MKNLSIVIIITLFVGCNLTNQPTPGETASNVGKISYTKDEASGLCFGMINSMSYPGYQITSMTCVPCDSVKDLLINE